MPAHLFVYGTLRRGSGHPMAVFLERHGRYLERARTPGRLYDLGNYPGMCPAQTAADWVHGDVFELLQPEVVLAALDSYEGCGPGDPQPWLFARQQVQVQGQSGVRYDAWSYLYQRPPVEEQRIASGEYVRTDLQDFDWRQQMTR